MLCPRVVSPADSSNVVAHVFIAPSSAEPIHRPLPAVTLPERRDDRRAGAVLSVLLHVLIITLLVTPFAVHEAVVERAQGAGGPGPAGGGGGGRGGTGGVVDQPRERLQFIALAPAPPAVVPQIKPEVVPATPVVPPPPVPQPPVPEPKAEIKVAAAPALPEVAATPGAGGGTGRDGTAGSGPGTGGGVGSGVGTGRGSGIGPGTGGGMQENYPPTPTELYILPLPIPDKVRGFHLVAEFDVDETGRVLGFEFTRTRDSEYNKRLQEVLRGFRFRPGTRPDGTPIRMKAQIVYDLGQ